MIFLSAKKTKPITLRLPVEVLDEYKEMAEKEGVALSKFLAESCVSWIEAAKQMDKQQEPESLEVMKDPEGRQWVKVEGEQVFLTDPYSHKPHTFFDWD
jgi:hypothetical protein